MKPTKYLIVYWTDGEKREIETDNWQQCESTLRFLEAGTRFEVFRHGANGDELMYGTSGRPAPKEQQ